VELPAYGATARAAVDAVRNGKRTRLKARARLPVRLDVGMEPFSVLLLEVTEAEA
jgi:hypothetical protein